MIFKLLKQRCSCSQCACSYSVPSHTRAKHCAFSKCMCSNSKLTDTQSMHCLPKQGWIPHPLRNVCLLHMPRCLRDQYMHLMWNRCEIVLKPLWDHCKAHREIVELPTLWAQPLWSILMLQTYPNFSSILSKHQVNAAALLGSILLVPSTLPHFANLHNGEGTNTLQVSLSRKMTEEPL